MHPYIWLNGLQSFSNPIQPHTDRKYTSQTQVFYLHDSNRVHTIYYTARNNRVHYVPKPMLFQYESCELHDRSNINVSSTRYIRTSNSYERTHTIRIWITSVLENSVHDCILLCNISCAHDLNCVSETLWNTWNLIDMNALQKWFQGQEQRKS